MSAQVISITDAAAERINEIMSNAKDNTVQGVRVNVVTGGCAGMSYEMNYINEKIQQMKLLKTRVLRFLWMLRLLCIFWEQSWIIKKINSHLLLFLTILMPTERCGCGESFKI